MKVLVTGAAGFIGSNLVDSLLERGIEVIGFDNFSTGREDFLKTALRCERFTLVRGDILDCAALTQAMHACDFVYHLAANADVRDGLKHPMLDLEQNTIGTARVLEAMRASGTKNIVFSSTGSIYGEAEMVPTPENAPNPLQTSLYGASKIAGEALIAAYCEGYGMRGWIFRFVSILGPRYTHGHVYDFVAQLRKDPSRLTILGNGRQTKSYLHVSDCLAAIHLAIAKSSNKVNIFNLGTEETITVAESVGTITSHLGLSPSLSFGSEDRGWVGDNPLILLSIEKIKQLGWKPQKTIRGAICDTVDYLKL